MQTPLAFCGVFVYGAFVYLLMQQTAEEGASLGLLDALVTALFLLNGMASLLIFKSAEVQLFFLLLTVNFLQSLVLHGCKLGKRWTMTFMFIGISLAPIVFLLLFATAEDDCAARAAAVAIIASYALWFLSETSKRHYQEDKEVFFRVAVVLSFAVQCAGAFVNLGHRCGLSGLNVPVALGCLRFFACTCLAYAVSTERMSLMAEQ